MVISNFGACFRICSTQATPAIPFPITTSFSTVTTPPGENSSLQVRASFGGFSHRSSRKTPVRENSCPFRRFFLPARTPLRALLQQDQTGGKEGTSEKE